MCWSSCRHGLSNGLKVIYDALSCFFENKKTKFNLFDFIEFKVFLVVKFLFFLLIITSSIFQL